jgi:hypothetical protein
LKLRIPVRRQPPIILLRCRTRLLKRRETLLQIVQTLPQMLVHILRHLHLGLQFLKVFYVNVVTPLIIRRLLLIVLLHVRLLLITTIAHMMLLLVLGLIVGCLLLVRVLRSILLLLIPRSTDPIPARRAVLRTLRPAVRQTHLLTAPLKLLLILFAHSRRSHSLRGCTAHEI